MSTKIIGIDPGYDRCGVAVIEKNGNASTLLYSACITTNKSDTFSDRLAHIGSSVTKLIKEYTPNIIALERLYFTKNQKTAMAVAETRGALIYIGTQHSLPVCEFTPQQIKQAVTGSGSSDKKQVMKMVELLVRLSAKKRHDDEYDAIAVGLACAALNTFDLSTKMR